MYQSKSIRICLLHLAKGFTNSGGNFDLIYCDPLKNGKNWYFSNFDT